MISKVDNSVNLVMLPKGGAGKSTLAKWLGQFIKTQNSESKVWDCDVGTASLDRTSGLDVIFQDKLYSKTETENGFERELNLTYLNTDMFETMVKENVPFVLDTGAAKSFQDFFLNMKNYNWLQIFKMINPEKTIYIHLPITGNAPEMTMDCFMGIQYIINSLKEEYDKFQNLKFVIWEHSHSNNTKEIHLPNGQDYKTTDEFKEIEKYISEIISINFLAYELKIFLDFNGRFLTVNELENGFVARELAQILDANSQYQESGELDENFKKLNWDKLDWKKITSLLTDENKNLLDKVLLNPYAATKNKDDVKMIQALLEELLPLFNMTSELKSIHLIDKMTVLAYFEKLTSKLNKLYGIE